MAPSHTNERQRLARLRQRLMQARVEAFLITHPPNVFYLSGFTGDSGALLLEPARTTLFTDSRFTTQARQELAGTGTRLKIVRGSLGSAAATELVARRVWGAAAFEAARVSVAEAARLRQAGKGHLRWKPVEGWVEALRRVKDVGEIGRIREAAHLVSGIFEQLLPYIQPGVRECDLAAEIELRMRREGPSLPSFETIVASGSRGAFPHARATTKPLQTQELVVIDMGAILRHYCSDMTRTVYLGRAPSRVRHWYQAVVEAQAAAIVALRPGAPAGAADVAARRVLRKHRLEGAFVHSTGHGLGLEVHEDPRLGRGQTAPLEALSVVTVEPGIYMDGVGGIRVEDDVLVLPTGPVFLTTAPREFLEL